MYLKENVSLGARPARYIVTVKCDHCNKVGPAGVNEEVADRRAEEKGFKLVSSVDAKGKKRVGHFCSACSWRANS